MKLCRMGTQPISFGVRLRELREAAGLTQEQLAELIGVQRLAIIRWESGEREPGWGYVQALADALSVSCEAFRDRPSASAATEEGEP